jgi:hypothetical protein
MMKIVVGRGKDRHVEQLEQSGKAMHEQRRNIKLHVGLLHN